ncbi:MAG: hypothetical protein HYY90_02070 [Candidatus Omnitrophica bacterium]|nr:hypothetical protein [Candidatus Omnitrophota bacterium]
MKRMAVILCGLSLIALAGCESLGTAAQSKTNQGALFGGLLGAGTGAIIGNQSDHAGAGTAIGGALGALGGGLIGHALEAQSQANQRQQFPPVTPPTHAPGGVVKYSPMTGKEYPAYMRYDPETGVELRVREP